MINASVAAAPQIRLVINGIATVEKRTLTADRPLASLLISYATCLESFLKKRTAIAFRSWVLDSGAFSAFNSGKSIDLGQYIAVCQKLMAEDPQFEEIFSLDVIGDWRQSIANAETMWKAGVPAIPTFHFGSPPEALRDLAAAAPKIALGGVAKTKKQVRGKWMEQCFSRVWPHKIHGFGIGDEESIMRFPFHSCDATSWYLQPSAYGLTKAWGKLPGLRALVSNNVNVRSQVDHYLALETLAQKRWASSWEAT